MLRKRRSWAASPRVAAYGLQTQLELNPLSVWMLGQCVLFPNASALATQPQSGVRDA
jgi:hypothetical protein